MNEDNVILSKAQVDKKKNDLYKSSFADAEPHTVYKDPLGKRMGRTVNLQEKWFEEDKDMIEEFNELHSDKGYPLSESITEVCKNYDTGDFSLPAYYMPEVYVVNPELTPMADLIPRETVDQQQIVATSQNTAATASAGLETTNDSEGSYSYSDGNYTAVTYDVKGYGLASRLEDKLVLAADSLRSTESVAERAHVDAIRQFEERQILFGTNADASGFNGVQDFGTKEDDVADPTSIDYEKQLRDLIDSVEDAGGKRGSIVVVTDFETHAALRNSLSDYVRYEDIGDQIGYGFSQMVFEGVPIYKSHAITKASSCTSGDIFMFAIDFSSHYMGMLKDVSIRPLAKVGPAEQFATDAYGALVSEANSHARWLEMT